MCPNQILANAPTLGGLLVVLDLLDSPWSTPSPAVRHPQATARTPCGWPTIFWRDSRGLWPTAASAIAGSFVLTRRWSARPATQHRANRRAAQQSIAPLVARSTRAQWKHVSPRPSRLHRRCYSLGWRRFVVHGRWPWSPPASPRKHRRRLWRRLWRWVLMALQPTGRSGRPLITPSSIAVADGTLISWKVLVASAA